MMASQMFLTMSVTTVLLISPGLTAPAPTNPLAGLLKEAPLLGPLAGLAGGSLLTAGLGFAGKNSILDTINTIANVANAKIDLINLGTNLVGAGLQGAGQLQQSRPQYYGGYQGHYRPGYNSYG